MEYAADLGLYAVTVRALATSQAATYYVRHVVLGVGSRASCPPFAPACRPSGCCTRPITCAARPSLPAGAAISIMGSGQSAAEVFYDLLTDPAGPGYSLAWFSRADRFYPMEYSKLTLEFTSPDYVDYFYDLPPAHKKRVLAGQDSFRKGINFELINATYDELYDRSALGEPLAVHIQPTCELTALATP